MTSSLDVGGMPLLRMRLLVQPAGNDSAQRLALAQGHPPENGVWLPEGQVPVQGVPQQVQTVQEGNHVPAAAPIRWPVHAVLAEPENVVDLVDAWWVGI